MIPKKKPCFISVDLHALTLGILRVIFENFDPSTSAVHYEIS